MDIEKRFQEISKNPDAPLSEFDNLYSYLVDTLSPDPQKLNEQINKLKIICLDRAIDHSKYRCRDISVPSAKQSKPPASTPKSVLIKDQALDKSSIDIKNIVKICREKAPFLSFGILRLNNLDPSLPEKFQVLYSKLGDESWINKTFHPDIVKNIADFPVEKLDPSHSWILLCLFCSSDPDMVPFVNSLLEKNSEIKILNLSDLDKGEDEAICWKKSRENLFSETFSEKRSMLISDLLDAEQERLIKGFFGSNVNFLVYSELKGGFSDARVILVFSNVSPGDQRKYVIKICPKSAGKLKNEFENFNNHVEPFWVKNQNMRAEYVESSRYQAIRYPFASGDTILPSISFTKKYNQSAEAEDIQLIVTRIFDHDLYAAWRNTTPKRQMSAEEAFKKIINSSKYEPALDYLLSPTFSNEFTIDRKKLKKVLGSKIDFLECLNHGDLRSDNIQVDEKSNDVFLIDFGFTGFYPAGLDYAALEASIRFNLLDYSVDPRILAVRDADPLLKFDNLIVRGEKTSGEIDKAAKVCSVIRERFLNDFSTRDTNLGLRVQYLFCLLALCLRQIQYNNLNRRYILQAMSQILLPLHNHIVSL